MKKINVICKKENNKFIREFLKSEKIDFKIFDLDKYKKSEKFEDNIKNNDLDKINKPEFNAEILQSIEEKAPTRLLIHNDFYHKEYWEKEYTLYHELGHYYSINEKFIFNYYKYLEENKLEGELYNIPLEIEAEKYVFNNYKELFDKNSEDTYLKYSEQIKDNLEKINNNSIKNSDNFKNIYEVRVFRYYCIIENIYNNKTVPHYKKCKENIKDIKNSLESKGKIFSKINKKIDFLNKSLQEDFYLNKDFKKYINNCDEIYKLIL